MRILPALLTLGLSTVAFAEISVAEQISDHAFFEKAAQGGMTDFRAGKLAQTKGTTDPVRKFGAMMVEDHGAANEKLAALAKAKGITLPTAPNEKQAESLKELQAKDGARFDPEYIAFMIRIHEDSAQLLKSEIATGRDADAKAFAQELLPTVESHLREAYRLAGKDGKSASIQP